MDTLHIAIKNRFIFEEASFSRQNHFLARNRLFFDHLFNYLLNLQGSSLSARQIREDHGSDSRGRVLYLGVRTDKREVTGCPLRLLLYCTSQVFPSSVVRKVFIIRQDKSYFASSLHYVALSALQTLWFRLRKQA